MKATVLLSCILFTTSVLAQKRIISIDKTVIHIQTIGLEDRKVGQPVVVFESGYGTPMDHWDSIISGVSKLAPLITYDRPGIGLSETIDETPTLKNVSTRLVRILSHLSIDPPYILVGHSLGGLYIRGFAKYYPNLLAGLVFIDPADFTETHQNKRLHYEVLKWEPSKVDSLIQSFINNRKNRHTEAPPGIRREGEYLEEIRNNEFDEIQSHALPNIPVHILSGGRYNKPPQLRSKVYDEEKLFRSKMKYRINRWIEIIQSVDKGTFFYSSDAGHFVHIDDRELLISSIKMVLNDYQLMKKNVDLE